MARILLIILTFSLLFLNSFTTTLAFNISDAFFGTPAVVGSGPQDLSDIYNPLIGTVYMVAGIVVLASLIYGGYSYIMGANSGDAKQVEQGRKAITWALIGAAAVFSVYWIVQIVDLLFGFQGSLLNPPTNL